MQKVGSVALTEKTHAKDEQIHPRAIALKLPRECEINNHCPIRPLNA
jgi:hypothetical protein